MWILAFSCGFVAGIALAATHDAAWAVVLCPAIAFTFLLTSRTRRTVAVLVFGSLLFGLLGAARYEQSLPTQGPSLVSFYNEYGQVNIRATVCEEPDPGGRYTQVLLDQVSISQSGRLLPLEGRISVTTSDPRPLHYGDDLSLSVSLETPAPIGDFDYAGYLALSGVYSTAFCPDFEFPSSADSPSLAARLMSFNSALGKAIESVLPEPESSLARSLLLGRRGSLSESVSEAFVRTGTAHLLAISGLHLGILVAVVMAILLGVLGRRHYLYVWLGLLALWTYALFTGMRPPVVRAAIMASTFLVAELAGRQKHAPTALALAAAIMVAIEPQLLWRTSFQLSVLAMAGLILLFPPLRFCLLAGLEWVNTRGLRLPAASAAADIIAATLAATIAVAPVCAGMFGQLSVVGIPVSLLTLPALPFALGASSMAGLVGLASPAAAAPFAWVAWLFLTYIIKTILLFSALPWAVINPGGAALWVTAVFYILLCFAPVIWQRMRKSVDAARLRPRPEAEAVHGGRWHWALPPLLLVAVLTYSAVTAAPDGLLHVIFLDAGQGDAILIKSPSGRTMLVDGGPDGRTTCALVDGHLPFWDRSLDVVVMTHPHADHLSGLLTVIDRYKTGLVLESSRETTSLAQEEWQRRLVEASVPTQLITGGHNLDMADGARVEFLNPPSAPLTHSSDDTDNNGVVLKVSLGEVSFLLAADIRAEAETLLLHEAGDELHCQVLKVAHHGSDSSSTMQFLAAVSPQLAVISVGADNPYGHPHPDVLSRLSALGVDTVTTRDSGTIELVTNGSQLWIRTERPSTPYPDA